MDEKTAAYLIGQRTSSRMMLQVIHVLVWGGLPGYLVYCTLVRKESFDAVMPLIPITAVIYPLFILLFKYNIRKTTRALKAAGLEQD